MSSYTVNFTDSTNPAKPPLEVQDGALNTQTSLGIPGRNYSGYGPVIAENFVHLLESFANDTPPTSPVQGQLWYDTSSNNNVLRVYDGAGNWNEAGNLKKASFSQAPNPAASVQGDLWCDTTNSQLYLFSGSQWLLVGPQFSSGLQTGPVAEQIIDTLNVTHPVISLYAASTVDNTSYRVAIISKDKFTPKTTILGYPTINEGMTLYSNSITNDTAQIWGTAQNANNLIVNNAVIPASSFIRKDVADTTNQPLNIRNKGGLTLGSDLTFGIAQGQNNFGFYSTNASNSVDFILGTTTMVHIDPTGKVGIGANNLTPSSTLDVAGTVTATGLTINDSTPSAKFTVDPVGNALTSSLPSTFSSSVDVTGTLTVGNSTTGLAILPSVTGTYDIGSALFSFRNIYAQSFVGSFTGSFSGNVIGSVSGTADRLKTPTVFQVAGDIVSSDLGLSFTGQTTTGTGTLNTVVSSAMITGKTKATYSLAGDQMLVYQTPVTGTAGLVSMDRKTFLTGASVYVMPIGTILPFAGLSTSLPPGYLLCDGSEISRTTYNQLFLVIGFTYGASTTLKGANSFALPDFRGRFPLGRDNMNNFADVQNFSQAIDSNGNPVATGGQIGAAGRVTSVTASTLGGSSGAQTVVLQTTNLPNHSHTLKSSTGNQYYAVGGSTSAADTDSSATTGYGISPSGSAKGLTNSGGVNSASTGQAVNTMNPYLAVNYIIFTGVL